MRYIHTNVERLKAIANEQINRILREGKEIPRVTKEYRYMTDYLSKPDFNPASSLGRRVVRAIEQGHATWDLKTIRGHGLSTGKVFQGFDEKGLIQEGIQLKNRVEESRYGQYINALKKAIHGDPSEIKKFTGKTYVDSEGNRHEFITDEETLYRLHKVGELPNSNDIYKH